MSKVYNMKDIDSEFRLWQQNAILDYDLTKELENMDDEEKKMRFIVIWSLVPEVCAGK